MRKGSNSSTMHISFHWLAEREDDRRFFGLFWSIIKPPSNWAEVEVDCTPLITVRGLISATEGAPASFSALDVLLLDLLSSVACDRGLRAPELELSCTLLLVSSTSAAADFEPEDAPAFLELLELLVLPVDNPPNALAADDFMFDDAASTERAPSTCSTGCDGLAATRLPKALAAGDVIFEDAANTDRAAPFGAPASDLVADARDFDAASGVGVAAAA